MTGIGMKNRRPKAPTAKDKNEERCRACGSSYALHLHHAVPRSKNPQGIHDLRNCIVLCARCHHGWHMGQPIYRDVFTSEEWNFIRILAGPGWLDKRYPVRKRVLDW